MSMKSTLYTDPEMEVFIRATAPTTGWGTRKQYEAFCERFPNMKVGSYSLRRFAERLRGGGHVSPTITDTDESERDLEGRLRDHRKELERKAQERLLSELLTRQSRTQQLLETVDRAIRSIPPLKVRQWPKPKSKSDTAQDAIILLSDLQAGQVVIPEEIGGFNAYNHEVMLTRFETFQTAVFEVIRHQQSAFPVNVLHLFSLGDLVEGDRIYKAQRHYIDQDLMKQVFQTAQRISEFLVTTLTAVDHINVYAVPGNHGRIGDKGDNKTYVNWDYVVMKTVELNCQKTLGSKADRITFNIPESFFIITEVSGHNWLLYHGDDIKGWAGIPWYGIQRAIGDWVQIFNQLGKKFEYAAQGHFHREAKIDVAAGEVFVNGNWVGTNEHSLHMRATGQPKQTMLFSHPEYGITSRHPIYLEKS